MSIVRLLGKRHGGYTRDEIARQTGINPNGDFTKILKALTGSGFVSSYIPFGDNRRDTLYYKLTDCFCWFWLHFKEHRKITETDYWMHHLKESEISSWRGIAFEEVCLQHVEQIKRALQVAGVSSNESAFIQNGDEGQEGMQIDLLIDRADDVVNVCEMKFCKSEYVVTRAYADKITRRTQTLEQLSPSKTFHPTLITAAPLHRNEYSDVFLSQLTIDDLFGV